MKIKPMLGAFAIDGIEYIESSESRALVEHRVPGLAGNYFQDMGTVPNTIVIAGTKTGDEARDDFLTGIREIFNKGEQTTFVADINTATDITDVIIEDLEVAEIGNSADSFRYLIKLRKYIKPPDPPQTSFLDAGILGDALKLVDALNALDALSSISNLGDPTGPVRGALDAIKSATGGLDQSVKDFGNLFSGEARKGSPGAPGAPAAPGSGTSPGATEAGTPPGTAGAGTGAPPAPPPPVPSIDPADPRFDPATGAALQSLLASPATAASASPLVGAVQDGTLAGIAGDDSAAAQQLAAARGTQPSQLIPPGQDAALILDPNSPFEAPPTILLRKGVSDDAARLSPALEAVNQTLGLFQRKELAACDGTPSTIPIPNLTPSNICRALAAAPVEGAPAGNVPGPEAEETEAEPPEVIDPSSPDLQIDPQDERIDVGAKFALQRMLKVPETAADAARLIRGIKGETLAGIFGDDLLAAVKVAQAHGTQRWLLVPKGEDAALVLDASAPLDAPPTIIFRGDTPDIRQTPARLDPALQKASRTFDLWQRRQIGACAASASAVPVSNLVPPDFCHLPGQGLLVIITEAGTPEGGPGPVLPDARVEVEGPSPSQEVKAKTTDAAGKAEFSDLPTGSYQVTATKDNFKDASTQVLLPSGNQQPSGGNQPPGALALAGDGDAPSGGSPVAGSNTVTLQLSPQVTQLILIEHPDQNLPTVPPLTNEARWGVLRKGGTPGGGSTPLPDTPAWQDASVRVNRPGQTPLLFPVDPDTGGADPRNGETTIHSAAGRQVDVISNGVHKAPIRWHVTSAQPLGSVDGQQEARLTGRVRFSLWADPNHITESNLSKATNKADDIVDDMSLLVTFQNDTNQTLQPTWDVGRQPSTLFTEQQIIDFYKGVIARCHAHGIQVLAGFGLVDRGQTRIVRFDTWLDDLTKQPDGGAAEAKRFADALVNFMDTKVPGFDGISFDIESCGLFAGSPLGSVQANPGQNKAKIDQLRRALRFFYHAVADRLAVDNRICAITVGGMMSDDSAILPLPSVPNVNPNAMLAARLHTYDLPIGKPNIIIRPMAYDNAGGTGANAKIPALNSDPGQFEWHNAIVNFALRQKHLTPQQFQLGIKDFRPRDDAGNETGQGGTVPEPARIIRRCSEILRPNRVGLVLFAMFQPPNGEPWNNNANYNRALNADPSGNPVPRPRAGQPLQIPLDDARLGKLKQ